MARLRPGLLTMSAKRYDGQRKRERKHEQLRREIKARREATLFVPIRPIPPREDYHADQRRH